MTVQVNVNFKPINELVVSLLVYADKTLLKNCEMGTEWASKLKKQFNPMLTKQLQDKMIRKDLTNILGLMVVFHDQPYKTLEDFTSWLNQISISKLAEYSSIAPSLLQDLLPRLENMPLIVELLNEWKKIYFNTFSAEIIALLVGDAREKERLARNLPAREFVEQVTGGVWLDGLSPKTKVFLVPQYHARPFNIYNQKKDLFIAHYPVESIPIDGEPSSKLIRLASALGDSKRLKIMQYLYRGERTFMDVVSFLGMSKSTVHYHMATLRAAGFIRVNVASDDSISYSLRHNVLNEVSEVLRDYIEQPENELIVQ